MLADSVFNSISRVDSPSDLKCRSKATALVDLYLS